MTGWRYTWVVMAVVVIGCLERVVLAPNSTNDYILYLLPWYRFASTHGIAALGFDFTNYTPIYSYLLLVAAQFDALASPLALIKAISVVFEGGNALLGVALVRSCGGTKVSAMATGALLWIAPGVLYNGPAWAQADSIWTFFVLVSVWSFARGRNGIGGFGTAVAVKAQAVFLGPFVLGMLLRRGRWAALWLLAVPAIYLALAAPVLIAGRTVRDVAMVYARQGDTFHALSMNGASLWSLMPPSLPYDVGLRIGIGVGAVAALALVILIARSPRRDPEFTLLAAAASLLLMPFVLPKMHDRYFYAFEVVAIVLAGVRPRYRVFAIIAQVDCVLSYLAFDRGLLLDVHVAALGNAAMLVFLLRELSLPPGAAGVAARAWLGYGVAIVATLVFMPATLGDPVAPLAEATYYALLVMAAAAAALVLRASLPVGKAAPARPAWRNPASIIEPITGILPTTPASVAL